jgi:hypothetical protein
MLQIDHIYEFLYQELFKDFEVWYLTTGVPKLENINSNDISIFTLKKIQEKKIFLIDQEPVHASILDPYLKVYLTNIRTSMVLATSEKSKTVNNICNINNLQKFYYFFHGFAALDWFRGYYSLNYNKKLLKTYQHDFITFNRIINEDRSYRIYFISLLKQYQLLTKGLISFGVADDITTTCQDEVDNIDSKLSTAAKQHIKEHLTDIHKLVIDNSHVAGNASANILRTILRVDLNNDTPNYDSFWHIVTETVFYYDKLHLTEKIFKPIVMKQPFMLLAAPGNLAYLKSYGFKTFEGIIDESYDLIQDPDQRIEAVVQQVAWYCSLPAEEKQRVIEAIAPIVEYNFHHFYGEFRHIITKELLDNTKTLFKEIGYDDSNIAYENIYKVLTN